jgi:hypothetical protein
MKVCQNCKKPLILSGGRCVYCNSNQSEQKVKGSLTQIQQSVKPIKQVKQELAIQVTSPCYDNIGRILESLNIGYSPFDGTFNCNLLFINCGTKDVISTSRLTDFVANGNVAYISDQASWIVKEAFPGYFNFEGNTGKISTVNARVADTEIKDFIGDRVKVFFDMPGWSKLKSISTGNTILYRSRIGKEDQPLMVMVPYGQGKIFYTCFHNHAQASDLEEKLLRLLILKQISVYKSQSIKKTTEDFGIDLQKLK